MKETMEKFKNNALVNGFKYFLGSAYFPFLSAAVALLCYYTGLDVVLMCYLGITAAAILLLLEDISPVLNVLLYLRVCLSLEKSPLYSDSALAKWGLLIPAIIIAAAAIIILIYRIVRMCKSKSFKLTPVLYGMFAFSAVIMLGGIGAEDYSPQNLMFGAFMFLALVGIFVLVKDNVRCDTKSFEQMSYALVAFSFLLVVELAVNYLTVDGIIVDGKIVRSEIKFGWGPYTSYGVLSVMTLPAILYLAGKLKYGFLLTAYSAAVVAASILCCSRQGIVALAVIYPASLLMLLIKGKNKVVNGCVIGLILVVCAVLCGVYFEQILDFFKRLFANVFEDGQLNGSGRMKLWKQALKNYLRYPIMGIGFYTDTLYEYEKFRFLPYVCHNTILQMMSACGTVGIAAYAVHRVQTVISFFKNITTERVLIVLCASSILITSLLDVHIFGILLTMVYSFFVAVLVKSEKKQDVAIE